MDTSVFGKFDIQISGLRCNQLVIGAVTSGVKLSSSPGPSFSLHVRDTGFNCNAERFRGGWQNDYSGSL